MKITSFNSKLSIKLFVGIIISTLFALPVLCMVYYDGSYIAFANETVAARYFTSAKYIYYEIPNVWLPQGHLTTSIQNLILFLFELNLTNHPLNDWNSIINQFSISYSAIVIIINSIIVFHALYNRRLGYQDLALLFLVMNAPIYTTKHAGFYYSVLPDYIYLNMVIISSALYLFLCNRGKELQSITKNHALMSGVFIGLAISNKITMLPIACLSLAPLISNQINYSILLKKSFLIICASVLTYLFIMCASVNFDIVDLNYVFSNILMFSNSGWIEPGFFKNIELFLFGYSYGITLLLSLFIIAIIGYMVITQIRDKKGINICLSMLLIGYLVYGYFVMKRPAGTTFYEANTAFIAISAMSISCIKMKFKRNIILILLLVSGSYAYFTFPFAENYNLIIYSKIKLNRSNEIIHSIIENEKDIIAVIPRNEYVFDDYLVFLLKGVADFPSWNIVNGSEILEKLLPYSLEFRTEQGGEKPNYPYPDDATIVIYDRLDFEPLSEKYPMLDEAISKRQCKSWETHPKWTQTTVCY